MSEVRTRHPQVKVIDGRVTSAPKKQSPDNTVSALVRVSAVGAAGLNAYRTGVRQVDTGDPSRPTRRPGRLALQSKRTPR